ncbi:hypothetical protein HK096_002698, partial [Nowakowskiella sp. JEL0078]
MSLFVNYLSAEAYGRLFNWSFDQLKQFTLVGVVNEDNVCAFISFLNILTQTENQYGKYFQYIVIQ